MAFIQLRFSLATQPVIRIPVLDITEEIRERFRDNPYVLNSNQVYSNTPNNPDRPTYLLIPANEIRAFNRYLPCPVGIINNGDIEWDNNQQKWVEAPGYEQSLGFDTYIANFLRVSDQSTPDAEALAVAVLYSENSQDSRRKPKSSLLTSAPFSTTTDAWSQFSGDSVLGSFPARPSGTGNNQDYGFPNGVIDNYENGVNCAKAYTLQAPTAYDNYDNFAYNVDKIEVPDGVFTQYPTILLLERSIRHSLSETNYTNLSSPSEIFDLFQYTRGIEYPDPDNFFPLAIVYNKRMKSSFAAGGLERLYYRYKPLANFRLPVDYAFASSRGEGTVMASGTFNSKLKTASPHNLKHEPKLFNQNTLSGTGTGWPVGQPIINNFNTPNIPAYTGQTYYHQNHYENAFSLGENSLAEPGLQITTALTQNVFRGRHKGWGLIHGEHNNNYYFFRALEADINFVLNPGSYNFGGGSKSYTINTITGEGPLSTGQWINQYQHADSQLNNQVSPPEGRWLSTSYQPVVANYIFEGTIDGTKMGCYGPRRIAVFEVLEDGVPIAYHIFRLIVGTGTGLPGLYYESVPTSHVFDPPLGQGDADALDNPGMDFLDASLGLTNGQIDQYDTDLVRINGDPAATDANAVFFEPAGTFGATLTIGAASFFDQLPYALYKDTTLTHIPSSEIL